MFDAQKNNNNYILNFLLFLFITLLGRKEEEGKISFQVYDIFWGFFL